MTTLLSNGKGEIGLRCRFLTLRLPLLLAVLWLFTLAGCAPASSAAGSAASPQTEETAASPMTEETAAQPVGGQIYLYGESHNEELQLKKELELWQGYYATGMRHLFVEMASYTADYLNLWMQAKDDTILEELYKDWVGTQCHSQQVLDFYRAIKETCPETIFHGTDVGHQYRSTGTRYLVWLNYKGLKDSDTYRQTLDTIEQGKTYYRDNNAAYRESKMVENFVQAYDALEGESVMGIYGAFHVSRDGEDSFPRMAAQLAQRYPDALHTADVAQLCAEDPILEEITIGDMTYTASYWGEQDVSDFSPDYVTRKFWRLEEGTEDFSGCPVLGDFLPYNNYPMQIRTGQVFLLDYTAADGTVTRMCYRADGTFWNGLPTTVQIDISGLS